MTEVVTVASQAAGVDAREANPGFEVCDSEFAAALGPAPRLALVAETDAHEGPVYIPGEDVLYFTTLPGKADIPAPGTPCIGYLFWGRPPPFQLWEDLQDLLRRTKADFDPTSPQARAAWKASIPVGAGVSGHA